MPTHTTFALYKEANRQETLMLREKLDQAVVPIMKFDYYKYKREQYSALIDPKIKNLPPSAPGPALDAGSKEAKVAVMSVFAAMKRNLGYGG